MYSAARFYESYTRRMPDDGRAKLKMASCLREAGAIDEAMAIFDKMLHGGSRDPRLFLELGRLYAARDEPLAAIGAFRQAYAMGDGAEAVRLLAAWGLEPEDKENDPPSAPHDTKFIFLDITDVLAYLDSHRTVSGIQRVVFNLVQGVARSGKNHAASYALCWFDAQEMTLREVAWKDFEALLATLRHQDAGKVDLTPLLQRCRAGVQVLPSRGDVLMILGAFWITERYDWLVLKLRSQGVKFGLMVHDIIPISHPAFSDRGLARNFRKAANELFPLCDFAIAVSEFTRCQVEAYASTSLGSALPIRTVALAQAIVETSSTAATIPGARKMPTSPYILCVGTIEARKNHHYLFNIWKRLVEQRGFDSVPELVIVGRWGWRVEALRAALDDSGYLAGKIRVLTDIADTDLAWLYSNAMFSVFPSLVEGWGLPIGESLAHGLPCIASNAASMPEVGGDFVCYVDPTNEDNGLSAISRAIDRPDELAETRARIKKDFRARSWADVTDDLLRSIDELLQADRRRGAYAFIDAGRPYVEPSAAGGRAHAGGEKVRSVTLARVEGWCNDETDAGWAELRQPTIRFVARDVPPGRLIRIGLRLELPDSRFPVSVRATCSARSSEFTLGETVPRWFFVEGLVADAGLVEIALRFEGPVVQKNPELPRYARLSGLCFADAAEVGQRLELLESLL